MANNFIKEKDGFFVANFINGKTSRNYCHLIGIYKEYDIITGKLQFFAGPKGTQWHYIVFIGNNPERIFAPQVSGHQFVYFDEIDKDGYCGVMDNMNFVREDIWFPGKK